MLLFIKRLFAWWDGATLGALFDIGRRAKRVGEDEYGNVYYEERKISLEGRPRRYVIYKGYADPSRVPVDWHGWLHHTFMEPPTLAPLKRRPWEKEQRSLFIAEENSVCCWGCGSAGRRWSGCAFS